MEISFSLPIVLASKSPRRKELLSYITDNFITVNADVDETLPAGISPEDAVKALAEKKAAFVSPDFPGRVIIGADTVVALDEEIMGKPSDKQDAFRMLKALSGREHQVFTGVCLIWGEKRSVFACETLVRFYPLSDGEILDYIATGEPFDKAGAYGIQGNGMLLVKDISGDFYNVMGFPAGRVKRELEKLGVN